MKNLKKVLALVLVIASLMGLATMASAAKTSEDYSDAASISHLEAVDVMSTLGVFDGISGAFSGDSILTREQAAKIITYMILGKDEADALVASVAPYTDVARDRWSAGSIAFCKNEGILAGVGYGKFDPDGKLTGVAFAKMCLVALGYDPDVENLTGSNWAVNTSTIAIAEAGITADLSTNSLSGEMTRENACQMAFNTLKADLVDYDDRGTNVSVTGSGVDVNISSKPSKARTITRATARVDERNVIDNIVSDTYVDEDDRVSGGTLQFAERYFNKLKLEKTYDSFGRPSNEWTYKSEKVGTYVRNTELIQKWTAKVSKSEMYNTLGSSAVDRLKRNKDRDVLHVWVDSVYKNNDDTTIVEHYFKKNSSAAAGDPAIAETNIGVSGNGVLTELYRNDGTGEVNVVMINTYLVQATSDYNTVNERVNVKAIEIDANNEKVDTGFLPTYIENDDFDVSGVKDGDYLLVTGAFEENKNWSSKGKDVFSLKSVTPATIQTGTVTEYTEREDVTVGGTKYEYNRILDDSVKGELFAIDSNATLVLDTYGYIMCVDEALTSSNFVYIGQISDNGKFGHAPIADAYFTDGTNAEIALNSISFYDNNGDLNDPIKKNEIIEENSNGVIKLHETLEKREGKGSGWYTFTGTTGGLYTLRQPNPADYPEADTENDVLLKADNDDVKVVKNSTIHFMTDSINSTARSVRANEDTVFVIKNKDDITAYIGISNVPDVTKAASNKVTASWICKDNGYARFVFIDAEDADVVGGSTVDYMFVLKNTNRRTFVGNLTYYKYEVVINGAEPEERWIADSIHPDKGTLYKSIREDSDGRINHVTKVTDGRSGESVYKLSGDVELTNNVLTLGTTDKGDVRLIAGSNSKVNLVINKPESNKKNELHEEYADGDDYVIYTGASSVSGVLKDWKIKGQAYLVRDDKKDDSELIDTLWLYVDETF